MEFELNGLFTHRYINEHLIPSLNSDPSSKTPRWSKARRWIKDAHTSGSPRDDVPTTGEFTHNAERWLKRCRAVCASLSVRLSPLKKTGHSKRDYRDESLTIQVFALRAGGTPTVTRRCLRHYGKKAAKQPRSQENSYLSEHIYILERRIRGVLCKR